MAKNAHRTIEVFRAGTFQPMSGPAITFSADDLKELASSSDIPQVALRLT